MNVGWTLKAASGVKNRRRRNLKMLMFEDRVVYNKENVTVLQIMMNKSFNE